MAGKTLINTETRNEVLQFLHELSLGSNVAGISTKAYQLHEKMSPKFIRGATLKANVVYTINDATNEVTEEAPFA